jgi:hypothetical protein
LDECYSAAGRRRQRFCRLAKRTLLGNGSNMQRAMLLLLAGLAIAAPAKARIPLGQYERWGAFREPPGRCFALSEPIGVKRRDGGPYVAIVRTIGGGPPRLHVAAGRAVQAGAPLRLEIGDRSFVLADTGGRDARADARIIAAIRRADRLRVMGIDVRGRHFHDDYPLTGAPSAIDAAIVGCL